METYLKNIAMIGVIIILTVTLVEYGLSNSEKADCLKWQEQAEKFPGFYITKWQAQQCDAHEIEINAPVQ